MCVQATLAVLMQRLASEHPHHTLHCLLALKNGNCGRDGRRADAPGRTSRDALVHSVDFDKVAAAEDVLNAVAKKPALCDNFSLIYHLLHHRVMLRHSLDNGPIDI